jgi:methylmalonyl-CoA/ethylmalonyl-CoA epimerase
MVRVGEINLFGAGAVLHHVGLVVRSITESFPGTETVFDPTQGVVIAFTQVHGLLVELLEPGSPKSPVAASLKKGAKLVHVCYEVQDIEAAIEFGIANSLAVIAAPVPAVAFEGRRIAWLYHAELGLFELVEAEKKA